MRTAHLFAGAGGGILADLILGHEPIVAVEWDAYACAVLRERFHGLRVIEGDVRSVDFARELAGIDALCAGFPCQDISAAGKGAGIEGERSGLYREVIRAIDAVRPAWVFLENSPSSEPEAVTSSSPTWWRVDIPGATDSLPRLTLALRTSAPDGGYWPTPTASLATKGGRVTPRKARNGGTLIEAISMRMYPTPTARDWKSGSKGKQGNSRPLSEEVGGALNPEWVEWLQGWPIGHTESKHWATAKSRSRPRRRGSRLAAQQPTTELEPA